MGLFDFLNQGLLGTTKEFTTFTKGLADNTIGYAGQAGNERLYHIVQETDCPL